MTAIDRPYTMRERWRDQYRNWRQWTQSANVPAGVPRAIDDTWLSRLRSIMVLRGGQRHVMIPGAGVELRDGHATLHAGGGGWWDVAGKTCVAAYQPKGAASLAASYVNLANSGTYDAAPGTAPTLSARGWEFEGGDWLATGLTYSSPTHSVFIRCTLDNPGVSGYFLSCGPWIPAACITIAGGYHTYLLTGSAGPWIEGTWLVPVDTVVGIAGNIGYFDGTAIGSGAASAASGTLEFHTQGNSVGEPTMLATLAAAVVYSDTLTAGEVATVSAAMAAL